MPGQGRLGDKASVQSDVHGCPACPHPGVGPAVQGSPDVFVNGKPALRVDDTGFHAPCCGPATWAAAAGAQTVKINGKQAFRMNDATRHCGGSGKLVDGSSNVIVGDQAGGQGGGGAADSASGTSGATSSASAAAGASGSSTQSSASSASQTSAAARGTGAAAGGAAPEAATNAAGGATDPSEKRDFIEIVLVGEDGRGVPGEAYVVSLPGGEKRRGYLDAQGRARIDGIDPGTCTVSFPDLDETAWDEQSAPPEKEQP